jgi:putative membrane protein
MGTTNGSLKLSIPAMIKRYEFSVLVGVVACWAAYTLLFTEDRVNWFLDAGWVAVGLPLLLYSRRYFTLTSLLYWLFAIHAIVLVSGGYWTYEKNPLGIWLQQIFQTERNHYDRFGHFMQGFVPAIAFRELYSRCSPLAGSKWLGYFSVVSCIAFSALFELLEWRATVMAGEEGGEFLGHQGDIWDAQWDMTWAIAGAILSLMLLSRWHDRQLSQMKHNSTSNLG